LENYLNESYIKLPNEIYDNSAITNEELTVLTLLYRNYMQYKSIGICSVQMLVEYMQFDTQKNHKIIATIKDAIKGLVAKGYITQLYDLYYQEISLDNDSGNKNSVFYVELTPPPDSNYFIINDRDLNHIFKQLKSTKISKFNLIRYFIACRRVSNNESKFGYLSQSKLKLLLNDSKTIQKYNKILQDDLHLIRYNNSYLTSEKHYCTTFIGRYDDEIGFKVNLKAEVDRQGLIFTDKIASNKRRSKKQQINNMMNSKGEIEIGQLESKLKQYKELEYKLPANSLVEDFPVFKNRPECSFLDDFDFPQIDTYQNDNQQSFK